MAKMEVKIGADTSKLEKDLERAGKKVDDFGGKVGKAGQKTKLNATPALTDFSRTIQDMPYGIQGVANNIQQLTAQFGYLSQQTSSVTGKAIGFKGAIGAMVGAIAGPAGILLAVSAITSLWVAYEKEIKAAIGTTDLMGDAIKEASGEIGEEIVELEKLKNAYIDTNTSTSEKKKIMEELQSEYPKYFGSMDLEKATLSQVTEAYDLQKKAIVGMGVIKALEAQKAPLYAKQAEMLLKTEIGWWDQLAIAVGTAASASTSSLGILSGLGSGGGLKEIESDLAKIDKLIEEQRAKFDLSSNDTLGSVGKTKTDKKKARERASAITGLPTGDEMLKLGAEGKRAWRQIIQEYQTEFVPFSFTASQEEEAEKLIKQRELMDLHYAWLEERTKAFKDSMSNIIGSNLAETFGGIADVIGTALVEGGDVLGALGQTLLQGLANFLSDMGGMLIEYGSLAIAKGVIDNAIATGGPVAIAAGVAAIGVGIALKAVGAALGKRASSGFGGSSPKSASSGGGGFGGGSRGGSRASFSNGSDGVVVFQISGTDLVGVLNRSLNKNKALGGKLTI